MGAHHIVNKISRNPDPGRQNERVETLDRHFFSEGCFHNFAGDLNRLLFGCEMEYIITKKNTPWRLMRKHECLDLFAGLNCRYGYSALDSNTEDPRVSKNTEQGYICVKPDFAYHILEIAFPPRDRPDRLRELIFRTFAEIDTELDLLGFERASCSIVPRRPKEFDLVTIKRHCAWMEYFTPRDSSSPMFYFPEYPALIAAAQVHLNILDRAVFTHLPVLYELEWKAVSHFSNSTTFEGATYGCARVLAIDDTLGPSYFLRTIPDKVPLSLAEYAELLDGMPKYFPADPLFPARDYSFLRPRSFGTVEFRSTCTQREIEKILAICAFRAAQVAYLQKYWDAPLPPAIGSARQALFDRAKGKSSDESEEFESASMRRLRATWSDVPNLWRPFLDEVLI